MRPLATRFVPPPTPPRLRFTGLLLVSSLAALGLQVLAAWGAWPPPAPPLPATPQPAVDRIDTVLQRPAGGDAVAARAPPPDAGALLLAFETVAVPGVRLLAVDFQPADGRVTIELAAPALAALLDWRAQVQAALPEPRWTLLRAQSEPGGGLVATIEARARAGRPAR